MPDDYLPSRGSRRHFGALAVITVAVVGVATGCGPTKLYSVARTRACLSFEHARIGGKLDFVASSATGGAFVTHLPDNWVTIAFGQRQKDAANLTIAYQRFAASNVRGNIKDVLMLYRNAVLLWHRHPDGAELALVTGCLS